MLGNWIKQTTTTTGTGDLTLATVSGFPAFSSQFAASERFAYAIIDDATGGPIERGIGYINGSGNLVRERPMATFVSGTYTGANASAVDLPAGAKRVVCVEGAQTALTSTQGAWATTKRGYGDMGIAAGAGTLALVADRAYAVPFSAAVDADIDALLFRVSTAAASGSAAKVAVFSVGSDGLPGVLLAESSAIAVDTNGIKTGSFTRFRPPARFFACLLSNGAPTIQAFSGGIQLAHAMGFDSVLIGHSYIHHVGATGLTFPATWTPVGNLSNAARPQLVAQVAV